MPHPALAFPLTAVAMNGLVYGLGWNQESRGDSESPREPLLPPGYVIAIVWITLFALMGTVYGRLPGGSGARMALLAYTGYCLAYPLLTSGLRMGATADLLNAGALLGALALVGYLTVETGKFPWLLTPLLAWTGYVNAIGAYRKFAA